MDTLIAMVVLTLTRLVIPFGLVILIGALLGRRWTAIS
jgi:hypothetical protein